jgi:hypothetical protein
MFRKNVLLPFSELKSKPSKQQASSKQSELKQKRFLSSTQQPTAQCKAAARENMAFMCENMFMHQLLFQNRVMKRIPWI